MCRRIILLTPLLLLTEFLFAQRVQVVTNHIGYDVEYSKSAVVVSESKPTLSKFQILDAKTLIVQWEGKPTYSGPVSKWKHWHFWTLDFSSFKRAGSYRIKIIDQDGETLSYPFDISKDILQEKTVSDLIYYFKGGRCTGLMDQADRHLSIPVKPGEFFDVHGGWYDATGDYGKHLSHLSFSSYFNPQQISFTVWSLFKTYEMLRSRSGTDFRQINRRLFDEAMFGADYLVRLQTRDGSFFRSIAAPGPGKLPQDRLIRPEEQSYRIKKSKDQSFQSGKETHTWMSYQASFRSGGGLAVAALCLAASYSSSGEFTTDDYRNAAERAFNYLENNNPVLTNDGKENIVDDYCALVAATELLRLTNKDIYAKAASHRAERLLNRLVRIDKYSNCWRANDLDRPFFHAADAGLPVVSLVNYYPLASPEVQQKIMQAVHKSLSHELQITYEVTNPFGYARQYVQDTTGHRKAAFFFPHGSDASPWWQGENARLSSMATAARMALPLFSTEQKFQDSLRSYAINQLNWILGLNPYDACMLQGSGHNNPSYGFFGTYEYTNAPGGIVNGITSGLDNEDDIEFNLSYAQTGKDYDWRWAEQWLPHASWFLLAVATPN